MKGGLHLCNLLLYEIHYCFEILSQLLSPVGQSLSFVQPKEDDQDVNKGLRMWRLVQCNGAHPAPLDTWTSLVGHVHIEANSNDSKDSEQEGIVYISPKSPVEVIQNISNISICCNRKCFLTLIVPIISIIPINLKLIDSHKTLERGYFRNGGLRKPSWNMLSRFMWFAAYIPQHDAIEMVCVWCFEWREWDIHPVQWTETGPDQR